MKILVKKQKSRIIKQMSFVIFMLMHSSVARMSLVVLTFWHTASLSSKTVNSVL